MTENLTICNLNYKHLFDSSLLSEDFTLNLDDLPPLLAPHEVNFNNPDGLIENNSNSDSCEPLPISIIELNGNDIINIPLFGPNDENIKITELNSNGSSNSELFDFDKELEYLLTEAVEPQFENNNTWLPYLPEKTALCNEFCNDFLKESAEQLQLQSHSPMQILGVDLDLYSNHVAHLDEVERIKRESRENIPIQNTEPKTTTNEPSHNQEIFGDYEHLIKLNRRRLLLHDKVIQNNQFPEIKTQTIITVHDYYTEKKSTQCEEKTFPCTYEACEKVYAKASHLKAHLRRHSGEKPFQCTWPKCEWKFSRSDELARHRRSHSGIKPYKCEMCDKCFSRSDHLAKHRKVHRKRMAQYGINFFPTHYKKAERKYGSNRYTTRL